MAGPDLQLQMFFGWVRTFVAHFLGKRNLEVYTARLASFENKRPEIRVFAVNSELYRMPTWKEFENVIRDALLDTSDSEKGRIIHNLRARASSGDGLKPDAIRLLRTFRSIMDGELKTFSLYMHCEAVIAALLECNQDSDDTLANLSKVLGLTVCLNVKIFIYVFPEFGQGYSFGFKTMLPCLLGTFPSSRQGQNTSWLSSHRNPDCVARDSSQSRFPSDGYPFSVPPQWPASSFIIVHGSRGNSPAPPQCQ